MVPPAHRSLGTKLALLAALSLVVPWLAATVAWVRREQASLDARAAQETAARLASIASSVRHELEQGPDRLEPAVRRALDQAAAVERLRSIERVRSLTEAPDLRQLVGATLGEAELPAAWIREPDGTISWWTGGRPPDGEHDEVQHPCDARPPTGPPLLGACREVRVTTGPADHFYAGALRLPAPAAAGPWAVFVERGDSASGATAVRLAASGEWTSQMDGGWQAADRFATSSLPDVPGLVVATPIEPAHQLTAGALLRLDAGPATPAWRDYVAFTGLLAALALAAFLVMGVRLRWALRSLVVAAEQVGSESSPPELPVERRDEIGALAGVLRDLRQSLRSTRRAYEREARIAAWQDAARGIAHEIKNPLMPVRGTVENLLRWRREDPPRFEQLFDSRMATILEEVANLSRIADSFSDFARLPQPDMVRGKLNDLLHDVATLHSESAPRAVIEEHLDASLPAVRFDPGQLRQVVTNLVKNAREALGERGGRVILESGSEGGRQWFTVSDDGPGAGDETLSLMFTPYFSTKKKGGGSGLGLFLCRRIVVEHGGTIEASRRDGGGLRVKVTLPAG